MLIPKALTSYIPLHDVSSSSSRMDDVIPAVGSLVGSFSIVGEGAVEGGTCTSLSKECMNVEFSDDA